MHMDVESRPGPTEFFIADAVNNSPPWCEDIIFVASTLSDQVFIPVTLAVQQGDHRPVRLSTPHRHPPAASNPIPLSLQGMEPPRRRARSGPRGQLADRGAHEHARKGGVVDRIGERNACGEQRLAEGGRDDKDRRDSPAHAHVALCMGERRWKDRGVHEAESSGRDPHERTARGRGGGGSGLRP